MTANETLSNVERVLDALRACVFRPRDENIRQSRIAEREGLLMGVEQITNDMIARGIYGAYPRKANAQDYEYWGTKKFELYDRGHELHYKGSLQSGDAGLDYFWDRLIGWQASGADAPRYGPFADPPSPLRELPNAPPVPTPTPPPTPGPIDPGTPDAVEKLLTAAEQLGSEIVDATEAIHRLSERLDKLAAAGIRVHL